MGYSKKKLIQTIVELERAIELTKAAFNTSDIPTVKDMHLKALERYQRRLETCNRNLDKVRSKK